MAKTPGPPKAKTAAPAQFDMNSRDRKGGGGGGKGGPGGFGGRGRTEKRAPAQIVVLPPVSVDRGQGWVIQKIGRIDQASHAAIGAEYHLTFEGHDPIKFDYLSAARDRSKEPPPEIVVPEPTPEPVAEATPEDAHEDNHEGAHDETAPEGSHEPTAHTEAAHEAAPPAQDEAKAEPPHES